MYYGSSATANDQQSSTGTWDSNFKGVWHLPNGTTLTPNDSTSNSNNGTLVNTPTATSGQIDGGANFVSGSNQYITAPAIEPTSALTVEGWFNVPSQPGGTYGF